MVSYINIESLHFITKKSQATFGATAIIGRPAYGKKLFSTTTLFSKILRGVLYTSKCVSFEKNKDF